MQLTENEKELLVGIIALVILIWLVVTILKTILKIIKWILKNIWSLFTGKQTQDLTHSNDWLIRAQARQEIRFQNAAPPLQNKPLTRKETRTKRNNMKKYETEQGYFSPTGWYFDKERGEWIAPDYLVKEAKNRWEWDDKKKIWKEKNKK